VQRAERFGWQSRDVAPGGRREVGTDDVILEIGDSALPRARGAGGSQGTASWGTAIVRVLDPRYGDKLLRTY
jgi:hypothetical protein